MPNRLKLKRHLIVMGLMLALAAPVLAKPPLPPEWSHAFDLKCRPPGKDVGFDKAKGHGIEVFRDVNNVQGLYVAETGSMVAIGGFKDAKVPAPKGKTPVWLHGIDLKVRPAGVAGFDKAKLVGIEVFSDQVNGNYIYITYDGVISICFGKALTKQTAETKTPQWMHGFDLMVRKAGEDKFDKNTKAWSIEVFRDENNGNVMYLCESGSLAVVPGPGGSGATSKPKDAEHLHGLDLKVRKGGQKDFDPKEGKVKTYGVEVFRDENNGNLIYITEAGSISVVPGKQALMVPTKDPKQPTFTHGLDIKCRRFGQKDWDKTTPLYGVETFVDENTACILYIGETGVITATPKQ